ncbi:MAG: type II toxin-antitoxin system VapC family toxin [Limnospira sp. PMC 1256.20]|uniref:type II toxin-antitoxin system tRNA(fMet)-specific endonuclease VapC n=1 Tax=unclassified Limnospira TaxID=2642885 RepID=UPI0028E15C84|nr:MULTISPECIES: type II toxin-antitoxin system VapC family toxin [unclassified Limnospira]MDT9206230.1 type II toxin-antitoxin system VapC family toxin [Limnospira sp. PMC 1243.20]MDT9211214.1 type II toxin-antitoxin system VapC family toxin [Limnospira sp. PMC 1252.20]MDT9216381.1 type II toxin-antitoxin system VapC family toxin [Limnospira sp. PMC 1256.20]MDT9257196.1 type II toxin-antitoxin system VapC family toxin [Limnospira sp. PMC 1254.20]MDT9262415.1 type II toxin-antitoxin system Vap
MRFLLDTNSCIIYLRGKNLALKKRLEFYRKEVAVCSVVKAELFYGSMKSANPEKNLRLQTEFLSQFISLPFDDVAANLFGIIRSQLEFKGTPIGSYDLQIAAISLAHHLTLVTHNVREFSRVEGLQWEDWEAER